MYIHYIVATASYDYSISAAEWRREVSMVTAANFLSCQVGMNWEVYVCM